MKTEQEKFWQSNFGDEYTKRTIGKKFYTTRIKMWADILPKIPGVKSVFVVLILV